VGDVKLTYVVFEQTLINVNLKIVMMAQLVSEQTFWKYFKNILGLLGSELTVWLCVCV